jgi:beta-glucosidase
LPLVFQNIFSLLINMNTHWKQRLASSTASIEKLLTELTLEEKVSLCHASGKFCNHGAERVGVPPLIMSDGPHGVRQELTMHGWDPVACETDYTTYLPVGTVTAAAWNPALGRAFGEVLGKESRARGKDVILGPGFNILRDPLGGRNFEYYSEDSYLISQLIPGVIQGIQAQDTAACAKHYALNNQELNRHGYSAEPDERTLREIYLPGFEAAVKEGEVLTLMGSYNKYNGQWCCHNKVLLVDILKNEWGFQGLVVSDWDGCHVSDEAATNGLDIEMGTSVERYDDYHLANAFLAGLKSGQYSVDLVNDKVRRILRVIFAIGLKSDDRKSGQQNTPAHAAIGRQIAEEGVVLLQNKGNLPLQKSKLKRIAVIGDNATRLHAMGGGSSGVKPLYEISPLEGLRAKLGDEVEIIHCKGYPEEALSLPQIPDHYLATVDAGSGIKGWRVEWNNFHQFEGPTLAVEFRESVSLRIAEGTFSHEGLRRDWWATRWTAELMAPESGQFTFALNSDFWARFYIDEVEVIALSGNKELNLHSRTFELVKGQKYQLKIEYGHSNGEAVLEFGWFLPGQSIPKPGEARDTALAAAKEADAVLFFGGLNHFHDNEGVDDRKDYHLPGGQDELIAQLAAVNDNVVVVLIGGSAHAMPWAEQVEGILLGGYAGMDCGNVFADILFGDVNPSGKLTYTFAHQLADYPARALDDYHADVVKYKEGVFVGYRWFDAKGIEPLFAFGHGLSYTTFALSDIAVSPASSGVATITVKVTNTGSCAGKEVVQLYLQDVEASVERPLRELKGFQKVALAVGKSTVVSFTLTARDCSFWDVTTKAWKCESGTFIAHVGTSSRCLPLRAELIV